MRQYILLILLLISLGGCLEKPSPIVSGGVVDGGLFLGQFVVEQPGHKPKSWMLTTEQLQQMSLWLQENQSGWGWNVGSPPPSFSIVLKHANGTSTQIDLFSTNESWQHAIGIKNSDNSKNGIKNVSTQEREALLKIVKEVP